MTSAIADVISVPTTRAHAPYWLAETSQLLSKTKPMTPKRSNAGLAHVLVDHHERRRGNRIPVRRRRIDRVEAQVVRDLEALDRRGRRVQRRRDVLAGLVLHRGVGEVVLERVGLLDVADRALVL